MTAWHSLAQHGKSATSPRNDVKSLHTHIHGICEIFPPHTMQERGMYGRRQTGGQRWRSERKLGCWPWTEEDGVGSWSMDVQWVFLSKPVMFDCLLPVLPCPEGVCGVTPFVIVTLIFCLPPKCTSSSSRKCFSCTLNWGFTQSFPNKARSHGQSLQLTVFVAAS